MWRMFDTDYKFITHKWIYESIGMSSSKATKMSSCKSYQLSQFLKETIVK